MSQDFSIIVSKIWNYAHVLKNEGVGYGDYIEQITYLLFLKPAGQYQIVAELDCQIPRSNLLRQSMLVASFRGNLA